MRVKTIDVRDTVRELDNIIAEYKLDVGEKTRDYRTYEQQYAARLQTAFAALKPLIKEAASCLRTNTKAGAKPKLSVEQKILLALLKRLFEKSNRSMALMCVLFSLLTDVSVSYKTIERIYSDLRVHLAVHNLHMLLLKKKGIGVVDATGDGTGYSLTITKHYATEAQRLKEGAKTNGEHKSFIYSFALMDLQTRLYIGYGTSHRSEQDAFLNAMQLTKETGIVLSSLRLDRYYSAQAYVLYFDEQFKIRDLYLIPKKNATIQGPWTWKRMLARFVDEPKEYLNEYFQRNQSESGFAEDKKRTGWRIMQQRPERIELANALTHLWHNFYWLGAE